MKDYFTGSLTQHQERARRLMERIPTTLPREFHVLVEKCNNELSRLVEILGYLLDDPQMQLSQYQSERLRQFRRVVEHLNLLETIAIAALERHNKDDIFLNRLIEHIRVEIHYPLLPPVVTSLSQQYFHIYPNFNLMFVPLSEGDFLLHLPDLYHELAHPLVTEQYDRRIKPFQNALSGALDMVLAYVEQEKQKEERRRGPQRIGFYLYLWQRSWIEWVTEFFCDLYAICTVGPAFAWSHIYLCAKYGQNPFLVPTSGVVSHPADDARMHTMLYGLSELGFSDDVTAIRGQWEQLIATPGAKQQPEYRRCFPDALLQQIASSALRGVKGIGCQVASPHATMPVYSVLNQAWSEFWRLPIEYTIWEREAVKQIKSLPLHVIT